MRPFVVLCLLCAAARADALSVGVGAHHAIVNEGGDHGSYDGAALEIEHALSPRLALRGELAYDSVANHSDEAPYAYDAKELVAMLGLRVELLPRDVPRIAHPYLAAAVGTAYMWIDEHPMQVTAISTRIEPLAAGVDLTLATHDSVRVEAGALLFHQYEDALALVVSAAYVHGF